MSYMHKVNSDLMHNNIDLMHFKNEITFELNRTEFADSSQLFSCVYKGFSTISASV